MSFFRNPRNRGQVMQSLLVLTVALGIGGYLTTLTVNSARTAKKKRQDLDFGIQLASGIETFLMAYRFAELSYIKATGSAVDAGTCTTAKPFLQALKEGSGCNGMPSLTVFHGSDDGTTSNIYSFPGTGCTITQNDSTCKTGSHELVSIGVSDGAQKFNGATYRFFLTTVNPAKHLAEFVSVVTPDEGNFELKRSFAVRPVLPNAAHHESADSRVTQENPDPLARCPSDPWGLYHFFDPDDQKCKVYQQLGGGTGLAYYRNRFFGLRPASGEIIDMLSATLSNATSYMVTPEGNIPFNAPVGLKKVFVPYKKEELVNTDDITLIGDQIYYVALQGLSAQIGVLDPYALTPGTRKILCNLGQKGWAQSYSGIAALPWSDELVAPVAEPKRDRLAVFFLKTDGGDLLTALVTVTQPGDALSCFVFKDQNLQAIEYQRTLGFDRTSDSKPYYIY